MKTKITMEMAKHYLDSKKGAWAESTLRSEEHRLNGLLPHLNGDAPALWKALASLKPYSRVTAFTRACSFYSFLIAKGHVAGPNVYDAFREENARLFKNAYQPKALSISFEEAKRRIAEIKDEAIRNRALRLLSGGLRFTESATLQDGHVVGKGGKRRRVFCQETTGDVYTGSYQTFFRALKKVGLKPHDLRKLCATKLVEAGLKEADLMKVMGWNSIITAKSYLQPKLDDELADVFKAAIHGGNEENEAEPVSGEVQKAS